MKKCIVVSLQLIVISFKSKIKRLIKYKKFPNSENNSLNWEVAGISFAAGGTEGDATAIEKVTLITPDSSAIIIDDPNAYFFDAGKDKDEKFGKEVKNKNLDGIYLDSNAWFKLLHHKWREIYTWFGKYQKVKLTVEIFNILEESDILTLT
ncbi:hypothetical protein ABRY23_12150 [Melioribacteraceae bacterium 4301-Me]|uniref:hypothetical protein n=1 Tax=Pyranulibacter aquaticus TaxID=3163344 RepID=UPI0035987C61